ncbi:hypothetical protein HK103_007554 [Boothiomyces macroporosus]|uniref:Uncharacterized protein n=1 Tax=Boothiomyces macroporosus TaxID=261099 RepID=A0AAD5UCH5_9FUNG|nr:hypothetical protein HK103_007554 [Boothiomyces macroporosus]
MSGSQKSINNLATDQSYHQMFKLSAYILLVLPAFTLAQAVPPGDFPLSFFDSQPKGTQFTTGACNKDSDCQTGCCGQNNKCRNPEALASDAEFCHNGLTIDFAARNAGKGTFLTKSPKADAFFASQGKSTAAVNAGAAAGGNAKAAKGKTAAKGKGKNKGKGKKNKKANNGKAAAAPAAAVQNSGQCPAGSSFAVSPQCKDAKTSTSPQGGPQFALFDKRCKELDSLHQRQTRMNNVALVALMVCSAVPQTH